MKDERNEYREWIFNHYKEHPPFVLGRSPDLENVKKDLQDFYDLITECLRVGDLTLLFDFAINPIFGPDGNINRLADPKSLPKYEESIEYLAQKSRTDFERSCMQTLIDCFKTASQSSEER